MEFEWDEAKRLSNIDKHDIDLLDARKLFDGRPVVELVSQHEAERRFLTIGVLNARFVAAVWTLRDDKIRFISVRRARSEERIQFNAWYSR